MADAAAANILTALAAAPQLVQRRDGVPEKYTVKQTMRKDGKAPLKTAKMADKWRPHCAQPGLGPRELHPVDGPRHERRPSSMAKKAGKRRFTDVDGNWADEYEPPEDGWSEEDEPMPDEDAMEDCGWRAGPASRELPCFKGAEPGPRVSFLTRVGFLTAVT